MFCITFDVFFTKCFDVMPLLIMFVDKIPFSFAIYSKEKHIDTHILKIPYCYKCKCISFDFEKTTMPNQITGKPYIAFFLCSKRQIYVVT